ncbi:MAG: hypothetical protein HQL51_10065 [Magnetococcales bacterium]|nr:hypothetical protein [Magnetococcales bacterium]
MPNLPKLSPPADLGGITSIRDLLEKHRFKIGRPIPDLYKTVIKDLGLDAKYAPKALAAGGAGAVVGSDLGKVRIINVGGIAGGRREPHLHIDASHIAVLDRKQFQKVISAAALRNAEAVKTPDVMQDMLNFFYG